SSLLRPGAGRILSQRLSRPGCTIGTGGGLGVPLRAGGRRCLGRRVGHGGRGRDRPERRGGAGAPAPGGGRAARGAGAARPPAAAVLVARWSEPGGLREAWSSGLAALVGDDALVLAADALPTGGLPDNPAMPTAASVVPPALATPPSYMTIQGSSSDAARM